jgi:hypothetical protein
MKASAMNPSIKSQCGPWPRVPLEPLEQTAEQRERTGRKVDRPRRPGAHTR